MSADPSERTRRIVEALEQLEAAAQALRSSVPPGPHAMPDLLNDIHYRAGYAQSAVEHAIDVLRPCLRANQQPKKRKS